ncbi:MAG: hypothetical protein U0361_22685 [Nitrospiraceae bacterium]
MSQIDAPGQTTQFQLQSSTNYLTQVTDALGRPPPIPTTATGMWPSITDPENNTTAFEYDATYSRLTKITDAMTPANITTFSYPLAQTTITDLLSARSRPLPTTAKGSRPASPIRCPMRRPSSTTASATSRRWSMR